MSPAPFHLRYGLNRSQRLVPLLKFWGIALTAFVVSLFFFFIVQTAVSIWSLSLPGVAMFGCLAVGLFVLYRELLGGLLDVLLVRMRNMDVIFEENAAGILFGRERWYLFLDGVTALRKFRHDVWTIQHFNGTVLHVPASAITDDQLAHIRTAMERGRTAEGIQAVIERGRQIEALTCAEQEPK